MFMIVSPDYSTELEVFSIFVITEKGGYNAIFRVIRHTCTQKHIMGILTMSMFQNSIALIQIERPLVLRKTNKIDHPDYAHLFG